VSAPPAPYVVTAVGVTASILVARWWATSGTRDRWRCGARPWRRAPLPPPDLWFRLDRVEELELLAGQEPWHEADAHLDQCWKRLRPLYPQLEADDEHFQWL
jgi:hypothetical protein